MVEVISDKRQVFNQIDDCQGSHDSSSPLGKYSNDSDDDNEVYNVDEIMTQVKDQFEDGQGSQNSSPLGKHSKDSDDVGEFYNVDEIMMMDQSLISNPTKPTTLSPPQMESHIESLVA